MGWGYMADDWENRLRILSRARGEILELKREGIGVSLGRIRTRGEFERKDQRGG